VEKLIEYGMWPLAVVVIALVTLTMFRQPISALIGRARKIGAAGTAIDFSDASLNERQQMQAQTTNVPAKQIENHSLGPASASIADIEAAIIERMSSLNEGDDSKTKRMVRALSVTILQKEFETIYRTIFGSQLELLLRANAGGIGDPAARELFENAKNVFPNVHQTATFEMWLSFPLNTRLIERRQDLLVATPRGKEFMQYLVEAGLTTPKTNG
jgi:hypothetical protein